jgi:cytochrome P450
MTTTADGVNIEDFDFYDESQFDVYARLQREAPVYYYEPLDTFVVSKYEDVRHISRTPEVFSNTGALTLNMIRIERSGAGKSLEQFFDASGEMVITLDPPRHREMKRTLTPAFNPRAVHSLEPAIAEMAASLVDQIEPGVPIEFVQAIAAKLPVYVAARVLGLEDVNLDDIGRWVNALEALTCVETFDELVAAAGQFATMNDYMLSELRHKRVSPGDDLMSIMLRTELDGQPLTETQMLSHLSTLISNGGTTRVLLASAVGLLAQHPRQRGWIAEDPEKVEHAIEEVLRVAPPARGFARLALQDVEIRGQQIHAGQYVYMLYSAANRDPEVFADAHRFDITRAQERMHLSFGYGTHSCLGAALVRMETNLFLRELLRRYPRMEIVEEPVRQRHVQLNGWQRLLMSFDT